MSKTQYKFQNRTLFVSTFLAKEDSICSNKSFFRQCVVLLFGKVSGATDGHCAMGSGNSLRRRQVHNCNRQLQLGWVGPRNLHLCGHSEGGWQLHKDRLSPHKLPGHVRISTISVDSWNWNCEILLSFLWSQGLRLCPKDHLFWFSSSPRASLSSLLTGLEFWPGLHVFTMPF